MLSRAEGLARLEELERAVSSCDTDLVAGEDFDAPAFLAWLLAELRESAAQEEDTVLRLLLPLQAWAEGDDGCQALGEAGAVAALAAVLRAPASDEVQVRCFSLLGLLSRDDGSVRAMPTAGVVSLVAAAVRAHAGTGAARMAAWELMCELVEDADCAAEAADAGVFEAVLTTLRAADELSVETAAKAATALPFLLMYTPVAERMYELGAMEALLHAIRVITQASASLWGFVDYLHTLWVAMESLLATKPAPLSAELRAAVRTELQAVKPDVDVERICGRVRAQLDAADAAPAAAEGAAAHPPDADHVGRRVRIRFRLGEAGYGNWSEGTIDGWDPETGQHTFVATANYPQEGPTFLAIGVTLGQEVDYEWLGDDAVGPDNAAQPQPADAEELDAAAAEAAVEAAEDLPALVELMRLHMQDCGAQTRALQRLSAYLRTEQPASVRRVFPCALVAVLDVMEAHLCDAAVQLAGATLLGQLLLLEPREPTINAVTQSGAPKVLLVSAFKHHADGRVLDRAYSAVETMLQHFPGTVVAQCDNAYFVTSLLSVLRMHLDDAELAHRCLAMMAVFSSHSKLFAARLLQYGDVLQAIPKAMRTHARHSEMQESACRLLHALATQHGAALLSAQVMQQVEAAMRTHRARSDVQEAGAALLALVKTRDAALAAAADAAMAALLAEEEAEAASRKQAAAPKRKAPKKKRGGAAAASDASAEAAVSGAAEADAVVDGASAAASRASQPAALQAATPAAAMHAPRDSTGGFGAAGAGGAAAAALRTGAPALRRSADPLAALAPATAPPDEDSKVVVESERAWIGLRPATKCKLTFKHTKVELWARFEDGTELYYPELNSAGFITKLRSGFRTTAQQWPPNWCAVLALEASGHPDAECAAYFDPWSADPRKRALACLFLDNDEWCFAQRQIITMPRWKGIWKKMNLEEHDGFMVGRHHRQQSTAKKSSDAVTLTNSDGTAAAGSALQPAALQAAAPAAAPHAQRDVAGGSGAAGAGGAAAEAPQSAGKAAAASAPHPPRGSKEPIPAVAPASQPAAASRAESTADGAHGGGSASGTGTPLPAAAVPPSAAPPQAQAQPVRRVPPPYRPPMERPAAAATAAPSLLPPASGTAAAALPSQLAGLCLSLSAPPAPAPPAPPATPAAPPPPAAPPALAECCVCLLDVALGELRLLAPCGHRCVCAGCAAALMTRPPPVRLCPKCREPVVYALCVFD